jgi:hypothetical protein
MSDDRFGRAMARWNLLRARLREAEAGKDHAEILKACDQVLTFSASNAAIGVVDWMFHRRAAKALAAQGLHSLAVARMGDAISGCASHRATKALSKPDDFLGDLRAMEGLRDRWARNFKS